MGCRKNIDREQETATASKNSGYYRINHFSPISYLGPTMSYHRGLLSSGP